MTLARTAELLHRGGRLRETTLVVFVVPLEEVGYAPVLRLRRPARRFIAPAAFNPQDVVTELTFVTDLVAPVIF